MNKNYLREFRESLMISKTELARKANISPATITRIEYSMPCRMETQRRIVLALGYKISDTNKIFANDMESSIKDDAGRRSGVDRRQFKYCKYIPEQRSGKERRNGFDRRKKSRTSE
ncbi:MAG: helix-turn-helix transcriptional regulator [Deltaproteobacteria bacterium]|nr:helix-turn-helix transcriptional regulator [Deltaproteobacteria bacterium]